MGREHAAQVASLKTQVREASEKSPAPGQLQELLTLREELHKSVAQVAEKEAILQTVRVRNSQNDETWAKMHEALADTRADVKRMQGEVDSTRTPSNARPLNFR